MTLGELHEHVSRIIGCEVTMKRYMTVPGYAALVDTVAAMHDEIERLRSIVAAVAVLDPIFGEGDHWFSCFFCDAEGSWDYNTVGPHEPTCLHALAAGFLLEKPQSPPTETSEQ